jgi:hypothetical protein
VQKTSICDLPSTRVSQVRVEESMPVVCVIYDKLPKFRVAMSYNERQAQVQVMKDLHDRLVGQTDK